MTNMIFFQMDWCFGDWPYVLAVDLILPVLYMTDFEISQSGLMFSWAGQCKHCKIELANQKLGPSPACKPELQQAGIYYLVSHIFLRETATTAAYFTDEPLSQSFQDEL